MKCLVPSCNKKHRSRGLCNAHYVFAQRLIKKGETTWDELIKKEKCLKGNKTYISETRKFFLD